MKAQDRVAEVFELRRAFEWRGLSVVPYSALRIPRRLRAVGRREKRFPAAHQSVPDNKACGCGAILRGVKRPQDCKLFGTVCTRKTPLARAWSAARRLRRATTRYGRLPATARHRRSEHGDDPQRETRLRTAAGHQNGRVDMSHGAGGRASGPAHWRAVRPPPGQPWLRQANDGAVLPAARRLVMATDSHVVSPLFSPGATSAAWRRARHGERPGGHGGHALYLAAGFILERLCAGGSGRIVASMAAATQAGVPIVTGDTKVVERGKTDGVFITTTGVGVVPGGCAPGR